jgi:hypothetical protein
MTPNEQASPKPGRHEGTWEARGTLRGDRRVWIMLTVLALWLAFTIFWFWALGLSKFPFGG